MELDAQVAQDAQATFSAMGAFLVDMGISPSELFAGMWGALFGIVLLGVPTSVSKGSRGAANHAPDPPYWCKRTETIFQALTVTVLSAIMAAYMTPILLEIGGVSDRLQSAQKGANMFAFLLGAGGRVLLQRILRRYMKRIDDAPFLDPQTD